MDEKFISLNPLKLKFYNGKATNLAKTDQNKLTTDAVGKTSALDHFSPDKIDHLSPVLSACF